MFSRTLIATLLAGLVFAASAQDSDTRLPQLGSSAAAALTPEEARQIGASMLHQMRALDMVLDDPQLDRYVNDLGYRLVAHADIQKGMAFTFFVVRDDEINAFAAPGGYIGVNAGLIVATENESELAGVLAHEIAHITQHHLERADEDARKMTPLIALTMLGAIAAASHGGSNGDAAPAAMASGMGLIAQHQINFTRKDEAEADRTGINTLAAAGFDVDGMAGFFDRMERLMRPGSGGIDVPEFLQTHPVTSTRISEAKALAHVIKQREAAHPRVNVADDARWKSTVAPLPYVHAHGQLATRTAASAGDYDDYRLMRERVRVLTARNNNDMIDYYKRNLASQRGFDRPATRYGYALALTRGDRGGEAVTQLQPLLDKQPQSLPLQLALADAQLHAGQRAKALAVYATLAKRLPDNHAVADAYADALLASGTVDDARKAAALLRPLLDEEVDEPTLYRTYGRACERAGQEVRAGEAFADATYLSGRATDALDQLRRLLKRKDLDYYERARIQARIEYITPIALELHRRGITADQQGM